MPVDDDEDDTRPTGDEDEVDPLLPDGNRDPPPPAANCWAA